MGNYELVNFDASKDGEKIVEIGGILHFSKLAQLENFKESLRDELGKIESQGGYTLEDNTAFKTDDMTVTVKLLFKKGGAAQQQAGG